MRQNSCLQLQAIYNQQWCVRSNLTSKNINQLNFITSHLEFLHYNIEFLISCQQLSSFCETLVQSANPKILQTKLKATHG